MAYEDVRTEGPLDNEVTRAADLPYSKRPELRKGEAAAIRERLRCGDRYYETAFKPNAERCRDLYKGFQWPRKKVSKHSPVINIVKYAVDTQVAATAHSYPEVILKPLNPAGQENEDRSSRALKWGYREAEAHRETKRALADCKTYDFGVVHVCWLYETPDAPPQTGRPEEGPDEASVLAAVESGLPLPEPPPPPEPLKDQPLARRIDPRQFRVSPEADWVIDNAPWCGFVELVPLDEVKADPRYRKGITRRLKGSTRSMESYLSPEQASKKEEERTSDLKRCLLRHYYEKRRKIHVVFADEEPEPILVEEWYWQHGRYPFRLIFNQRLEDEFYAEVPQVLQWEHMQKEINLAAAQLATHRARYNRKYAVPSGVLSEDQKKKLESGEDGTIIELRDQNTARDIIVPIPDAPLQAEVYTSRNEAMQNLRMLSTLDQYELGQAPTKRMTQDEVAAVRGAGGALKKAAVLEYERLCAGVAEDIFDLMQQYITRTMALPIYDPNDPATIAGWDPVSKDEIQGDYDFEVFVGSTEIQNRQGRVEEIGFLLQALQPYSVAGQINITPLIEQLLQAMPEVKDVAAIIQPPAPMLPPGMGAPGELPPPGMEPGMEGGAPTNGGPPQGIPPEMLMQLMGGQGG